jgi:glucose repression mediator protein
MHDPQVHPHHIHPLKNGPNPIPSASNGAAISPAIQTAPAPNGAPPGPTTIINKLNSANEQTWLLIGMQRFLRIHSRSKATQVALLSKWAI